jgi:hypothetical protein
MQTQNSDEVSAVDQEVQKLALVVALVFMAILIPLWMALANFVR